MSQFPLSFRVISAAADSLRSLFRQGLLVLLTIAMTLPAVPLAHAATTPSLGLAASYGVLAGTYTNASAATTINGDVGFSTGPTQAPLGVHPNYGSSSPYATAKTDAGNALSSLAAQLPCTYNFTAGAIDVSTDGPNGITGIYTPGIYCSTGAMNVGVSGITLNGNGTYIFRAIGALTSTVGSNVTLVGTASACDVFWTPTAATTLAATTHFEGTIIDNANAINVGANTTWTGRALSLGAGVVTTGSTDTITVPTCTAASSSTAAGGSQLSRRPLIGVTKIPNPFVLPGPGWVTYTYEISNPGRFTMNNVTLTDNKCSAMNYISGDNNNDALLQNTETWTYRCTMWLSESTSNEARASGFANGLAATDIAYATVNVGTQLPPPFIRVVKTPNLLLLPFGGGKVTYTYAVTNPGLVGLNFVQVNDDKCSTVTYGSGDIDNDRTLDVNETWLYSCKGSLGLTTINTVTVTGHANEQTAIDVAFATVVVAPRPMLVAPIIHFAAPPPPPIAPTQVVPLLPNTGVGPTATNTPWVMLGSSMLIGLFFLSVFSQAKRLASSKQKKL